MSTKAQQSKRLLFADVLRGLAVIYMIQLHTSHGWLLPGARSGTSWDAAQLFGGLAAPLFLLLAGAGLGLQWSRPDATATRKTAARGLELVVLGYALRLQMWILDGGAYARVETYPALLLLAGGYALAYHAAVRFARGRDSAAWAVGGAGLVLAGVRSAYIADPSRADGLVRVDVLQCIGASLLVLSSLGACVRERRGRVFALFAMWVALATPLVQSAVPGLLPHALAGYLAQWPSPEGERVIALFPLFPWLSFAASGVTVGLAWGRAHSWHALELLLIRMIAVGAVMALVANHNWAPLYGLLLPDSLVALLRVTYKTALCLLMIGPALAFARAPLAISAPLQQLGRASLLVYWVHLEFAFGTLSRPVARALSSRGWLYGTLVLVVGMWALATLRNSRRTTANAQIRGPVATG